MNTSDDTICAVSTAPGVGGIAVIRVSGPSAIELSDRLWRGKALAGRPSHTATFGTIADPATGEILDEGVATVFRAPHSFTGDDVVELSVHGSMWVQRELVNLLLRNGCRMAEPGEFTRRAFAAGKLDLAEAEAVADVIASTSRAAHRLAMSQLRGAFSQRLSQLRDKLLELASLLELELDFSEEDVEFADRSRLLALSQETLNEVDSLARSFSTGDAIRRGVPVAIIGEPNVGKSSILNRLLGDDRAIVSDIPGTTRDTIEDTTDIGGITFRFIDTAGLRDTSDRIEALGIDRAWAKIAEARLILWVITPETTAAHISAFACELAQRRSPDAKIILILNKSDLLPDKSTIPLNKSDIDSDKSGIAPDTSEDCPTHSKIPTSPAPDILAATTAAAPQSDAQIALSAATGQGFDTLRAALLTHTASALTTPLSESLTDTVIVTNARHYQALLAASASLRRVIDALCTGLSADFIAQDVRETIHHLSAITGAITTPDILSSIFSRFCIGK